MVPVTHSPSRYLYLAGAGWSVYTRVCIEVWLCDECWGRRRQCWRKIDVKKTRSSVYASESLLPPLPSLSFLSPYWLDSYIRMRNNASHVSILLLIFFSFSDLFCFSLPQLYASRGVMHAKRLAEADGVCRIVNLILTKRVRKFAFISFSSSWVLIVCVFAETGVHVFYTEDMYKMMRDTNRQLDDKIGPAVPVCIASGRSPETKIFSRVFFIW